MPLRNPVTGAARLIEKDGERYLVINRKGLAKGKTLETYYRVEFLNPDRLIGFPAWRLTKDSGENYDVILKPTGAECECEDFVRCRNHIDPKGCKHVAALRKVGLLENNHE